MKQSFDVISHWHFWSSGMLPSIDWWLVTCILGQPVSQAVQEFLDCLTFEYGTDRLSQNIIN